MRWVPSVHQRLHAERAAERDGTRDAKYQTHYDWVDLEQISPHAALAVIAAEDQQFPFHTGFDMKSIREAVRENAHRKRPRGASTITQQVAKNLFLWNGASYVRKGIEAWLTVLIEALWPKERILEVYLNIAQFGRGVYGVEAASQKFYRKPAARLSARRGGDARGGAAEPDPHACGAAFALCRRHAATGFSARCAGWAASNTSKRWRRRKQRRASLSRPAIAGLSIF